MEHISEWELSFKHILQEMCGKLPPTISTHWGTGELIGSLLGNMICSLFYSLHFQVLFLLNTTKSSDFCFQII